MQQLTKTAQLLPHLQELSSLQTLLLQLDASASSAAEGLQAVCQLTGLRQLHLAAPKALETQLLPLTQLRQLTTLYWGPGDVCQLCQLYTPVTLRAQVR